VRYLGSRNGTFLNDSAVAEPTPLKVGDEIRVGPLHFRVEPVAKAEGSQASKPAKPAEPVAPPAPSDVEIGTADVKRGKQPPVKGVADVVERASKQANGSTSEEDISRWLLGLEGGAGGDAMRETQTLSLEETTAITRGAPAEETAEGDASEADAAAASESAVNGDSKAGDDAAGKSGGWGFFKKKGAVKKSPGKLPPRPNESTKDSREAAADILREMTRRR
jgi:hypothetical protein